MVFLKGEGLHGVHRRVMSRRSRKRGKEEGTAAKTKRGYMVCTRRGDRRKKKKRGYMVCTSNYGATNTRKKKAARISEEKQAVTQRRPTPRPPVCET
jgi:hypothetical protein